MRILRKLYRRVEKFGPYSVGILVFLTGVPIVILARFYLDVNLKGATANLVSLFVAAVAASATAWLLRSQHILTELVATYIASGDNELVDVFLTRLTSRVWNREEPSPGGALFLALGKMAVDSDYEKKRRICEALPMLADIDLSRTVKLMRILREEFDSIRWHDDNRRRTIEALTISGLRSNDVLLLNRIDFSVSKTLLTYHSNDTFYTALSVAETLPYLECKVSLFDSISTFFRPESGINKADKPAIYMSTAMNSWKSAGLSDRKLRALRWAFDFRRDFMLGIEPYLLIGKLDAAFSDPSREMRVAALRACMLIRNEQPSFVLQRILKLANDKNHDERYVRRACARDNCVDFIIGQYKSHNTRAVVVEILESLLYQETDEIICLSVLDKAYKIQETDQSLFSELMANTQSNNLSPKVKKRIESILAHRAM